MNRAEIENAAASEKAGDENSIRALTDAVFNYHHAFPRMPSVLENSVKERLIRSEEAYLNGTGAGVREEDIVGVLNSLADTLGAPDFARANLAQLRYVRMKLAIITPAFMGRGVARPRAQIGDEISPVLSPLQATHLIAVFIDQKFLNEDMQVPPEQWTRPVEPPTSTRGGDAAAGRARVSARSNPKAAEMLSLMWKSSSSLSTTDGIALAEKALNTLGIN